MAFLRVCILISAISMVVVHSQINNAQPAVCLKLSTAGFNRDCPRICMRTAKCEYGVCQNCNLENIGQTAADQEKLNDLINKSQMELPAQDPCNLICPKSEEQLSEDIMRITFAFRYNGICTCGSTILSAVPVVG